MATYHDDWRYHSALGGRYASKEMQTLFSERTKVLYWRQLWVWLAEVQMELGLSAVRREQVEDMKLHMQNIDWDVVKALEKEMRHDVMAHLHAFERVACKAKGIIHLGATSAYVQDNADLIIYRQAADLILLRALTCLHRLAELAMKHKDVPTVGRTHYQPASLTTVGKRAALWAQELLIAYESLTFARDSLRFRGTKGATGTQNSFLILFDNDANKVKALDSKVTAKAGFGSEEAPHHLPITGQTYSRLQDCSLLCALAMLAAGVHKIAMDIRMLQCFDELAEPFESGQVGSSAMPYKRNPMRSERCCGLARFLMNLAPNAWQTAAVHGFERTLDDSSNRRLVMPEAFLSADALLLTFQNILEGLRLKSASIARQVDAELPFLALENVLMRMALAGADRQVTHEKIRRIALRAHAEREESGAQVDLKALLETDEFFSPIRSDLDDLLKADRQTGLCALQVEEFVSNRLEPLFRACQSEIATHPSVLEV